MKIVLTGSTGFVGQEVLKQCCQSSQIDSIVALSRRALPEGSEHPKVRNIIVQDFTAYSDEVLNAMLDADGCIWCLGKAPPSAEIAYPMAFVKTMTQHWSTREKLFRYVHCSGVIAEKDQGKTLWYLSDFRKAKGRAETELAEFATQRALWQTYIMRPSLILPENAGNLQQIAGFFIGRVKVSEVARSAINLVLDGSSIQTLENNDLVELGKRTQP